MPDIFINLLRNTLFGFVLVAAMAVLLFWNEGRAVKTARALAEGAGIVVSADAAKADPANEGKLIHISGAVTPTGAVADPQFGVKAEGAVRLARVIEMYQWKEISRQTERTNADGSKTKSTVYDYVKEWSSTSIESNNFKTASAPRNPPMPARGQSFDIGEAAIGAFTLTGNRIAHLGKTMPLALDASAMPGIARTVGGLPVWLDGTEVYAGADKEAPQVGDLKLRFTRSVLESASIVAAQKGQRLEDYTTSNGRDLFLAESGTVSAAEMFKDAIQGNIVVTWVVRILGLAMMFGGFMLTFSLLTQTLGLIPGIGAIVRGGASLMSLGFTAILGSVVIAIGWIFYRPVLGLVILAAGIAIAAATGFLGRGKQAAATAPAR